MTKQSSINTTVMAASVAAVASVLVSIAIRYFAIAGWVPGSAVASPFFTDKLWELRVHYRDTLKDVVRVEGRNFENGSATLHDFYEVSAALLDAELDLADTRNERIRVLETTLEDRSTLEQIVREQVRRGTAGALDVAPTVAERLKVQILLDAEKLTAEQTTPVPAEKLRKLREEYRDTLKEVATGERRRFDNGILTLADLHDVITALLDAELELAESPDQRLAILHATVKDCWELEKTVRIGISTGIMPPNDDLVAKAAGLKVEIRLEQEKIGERKTPEPEGERLGYLWGEYQDTFQRMLASEKKRFEAGLSTTESVHAATIALLYSQLESTADRDQRIQILETLVKEASAIEEITKIFVDIGVRTPWEVLRPKASRLKAEILLERERLGPMEPPAP